MTFRLIRAAGLAAGLSGPVFAQQPPDSTMAALQARLGQCALQEITAPVNFAKVQDALAAATKRAEEAEKRASEAEARLKAAGAPPTPEQPKP